MFDRPHHRLVAEVLSRLDGPLLADHSCWFGGGTAIALAHGEYRESVDIDFLVSHQPSYRALRRLVKDQGLAVLAGGELQLPRPPRIDNYGIRAAVSTAVDQLRRRPQRLDACLQALKIHAPRVVVWQCIRDLTMRCGGIPVLAAAGSAT